MAEILGVVTEDVGKRKLAIRTFLSVDLSKAYDKVRRDKLFEVLRFRARTEIEKMALLLIENMYKN